MTALAFSMGLTNDYAGPDAGSANRIGRRLPRREGTVRDVSAPGPENPAGTMRVRDVIGLAEAAGWRMVRRRGSHRQYRHPTRPGVVTIAGHPGDEVRPKTLGSILSRQV